MKRDCADFDWGVPKNADAKTYSMEAAHLAVLMDIRAELQALNRIFNCGNFLNMPHHLRAVMETVKRTDKRFAKTRKLK